MGLGKLDSGKQLASISGSTACFSVDLVCNRKGLVIPWSQLFLKCGEKARNQRHTDTPDISGFLKAFEA